MSRALVVMLAVGIIVGLAGSPVLAHEGCECPAPGPAFGAHIAEMAPEHPRAHGAMFGEMVSHMARGH